MSKQIHALLPGEDPFGQALRDHLKGKRNLFIRVHSDATSEDHIDVKYLFREFTDWPEIEKKAIALCRGKILELGSGAGSHGLYLQEQGFDITCLDFSPGSVSVMKERGVKNAVLDTYQNFGATGFDTILMLMNGIGIVGSLKGLRDFLEKAFHSILADGGQVIFDSSDLVYLLSDPGSTIHGFKNSRYYGEVRYRMEYEKTFGPGFSWLFVDFKTLSIECKKLGLKVEKIYEDDHFAYLARVFK